MTNKSAVTVPNALRAELGCQPGMAELENTKYKSVSFKGDKAKATITIADVVKNVTPSLFRDIFGKAYSDLVNVKHTEELTAEGSGYYRFFYRLCG